MKNSFKTFLLLNALALIAWGLTGGAYVAYRTAATEGLYAIAVAFWFLIVVLVIIALVVQLHVFRSLVCFLKAFYRWIEMRHFAGG